MKKGLVQGRNKGRNNGKDKDKANGKIGHQTNTQMLIWGDLIHTWGGGILLFLPSFFYFILFFYVWKLGLLNL